ncbi:plexin-B3-like, partial [Pteropus vampyrus]|uniref:Plexin-B3-like n=1 Tax=Pteropus vampyrus TaxID=132908 RepID=A0A6P3RP03_PTEVA
AEYRSYVARVCLGDTNLYSYVEVPLSCRGQGLIQAAFLAPGTLLGAFATGLRGAQAALCAFPLAELDGSMEQARRLCYTAGGRGPNGMEEATVEYGVTSRCVTLPPDSPDSYPCGDEHTPSPIAGRQPLEAGPLLQLTQPISAVAALQVDGHMVAFLGDTQGQLHKVFLNGSRGQVYHSQQVGPPGSAISPDLLADGSGSHLYVLTAQQVDRVPVAACPQFPDCTSCLQAQDPLCGWCVLQGRCTRKGQCGRAAQPNQWLWSYEEDSHCLHVQSLLPAHHPRQEQGQSQVKEVPGWAAMPAPACSVPQDPVLLSLSPHWGPQAGGTQLTIHGQHLQTGGNISAFVGSQPCPIQEPVCPEAIVCHTMPQAGPGEAVVRVVFGHAQRTLLAIPFRYTANPQLLAAEPSVSFRGGGRLIRVRGKDLDVVRRPLLSVWLEATAETTAGTESQDLRSSCGAPASAPQACVQLEGGLLQCSTVCSINSSNLLLCLSPAVPDGARPQRVFFTLDNVHVDFASASGGQDFQYQPNPRLAPLSREGPALLKSGNVLDVEGEGLNLGISKEEVRVHIGDSECLVKTLTLTHLYCEPPPRAPQPANGSSTLPQFVVQMGNLRLALGPVQYEAEPAPSAFPVEAQVGLGMGAAVLTATIVLLILMYR